MYELYVSNKQKKLVVLILEIYMINKICTLYRSREHFDYALLDGLDQLELDLKGSS